MKRAKMSRITTVRVVLEGELGKKFLDLKNYLGLKNNAEVIRHCISTCHTSVFADRKNVVQAGPIHNTVGSANFTPDKGSYDQW